jgi:hypothetical protein
MPLPLRHSGLPRTCHDVPLRLGDPTREKPIMTRSIFSALSVLALVSSAAPAGAEQAKGKQMARPAPSAETCETRISKLESSQAEGAERLAEKSEVIDHCSSQYKRDKTIERLVKECQKYEGQSVVRRQFVAECQIAAYGYANALYSLRAEK